MSVAYDLFHEPCSAPQDYARPAAPRLRLLAPAGEPAPGRAAPRPAARAADVVVLHAPRSIAPPLRLTRRGVAVLALAVAALAVALVWGAAASTAGSSGATGGAASAGTVTVRPGDTLWSIATRVAPASDPRAEVDTLRRVNHLAGVALQPGQVLALH